MTETLKIATVVPADNASPDELTRLSFNDLLSYALTLQKELARNLKLKNCNSYCLELLRNKHVMEDEAQKYCLQVKEKEAEIDRLNRTCEQLSHACDQFRKSLKQARERIVDLIIEVNEMEGM